MEWLKIAAGIDESWNIKKIKYIYVGINVCIWYDEEGKKLLEF